jgi:cyclopropane fatty-acyl-phospholipid synthase-like methyltransferase
VIALGTYDRVIDALGDRTYPFALEVGAATGLLSERLARRCGRLVTLDPSPAAVERARRRLEGIPNVDVRVGRAPDDLPEFRFAFDLIVCSEVLCAVGPGELPALLDGLESRLPRAGTLLVVSSRGRARRCDEVHALVAERPGLVRVHGEAHEDHLLDRFERR